MSLRKAKKIIRFPQRLIWAFVMEGLETKKMVQTFARHSQGALLMKNMANKPTDDEMKQAMQQLKDLPRILPFIVFIVVPMPGVTEGYVLLAITLERYLGKKITLLPNHFRKIFKKEEKEELGEFRN